MDPCGRPAAQMGAGLAAWFAGLLRVNDDDRKKIVVCGISASFAAVFGTPFRWWDSFS